MNPSPLLILIIVMSLFSFLAMGFDKTAARRSARRIPERWLFALALLGGALGGTVGMLVFHHKTRHWYFRFGFPLIAAAQILLFFSFLSIKSKEIRKTGLFFMVSSICKPNHLGIYY